MRSKPTRSEWVAKHDDQFIPDWVKERVRKKFGNRCCAPGCGCDLTHRRGHIDHILPLSMGGQHREGNMQPLCELHHREKTNREATSRAKADRIARRHIGVRKEPSIKVSRRFDGTVTRWNPETRKYEPIRQKTMLD